MTDAAMARWQLVPDGAAQRTASSLLVPVRHGGRPAMLKLAQAPEERRGARLMAHWNGNGAAPVLAISEDGAALLLARAEGGRTLAAMAEGNEDAAATAILVAAAQRLHRQPLPPDGILVPLAEWFRALPAAAAAEGGAFALAWKAAAAVLAQPAPAVALHGDIHHGNVLDFGAAGWLAIDPKGVQGPAGYDFANLFCNPGARTALRHFDRRLAETLALTAMPAPVLLGWILGYCGLSAAWSREDGADPAAALTLAQVAHARLSP